MNQTNKSRKIIASLLIAVALLGAGGYIWKSKDAVAVASNDMTATVKTASALTLDADAEDIDWAALPTKNVTLSSSVLNITEAGTYVLSGSSSAGITVNTDGNVRLALDGATITSTTGAAIAITSADNTVIQLVDGTTNTIEDAATRSDQTIDGAIYSADDLIFNGKGSLNVTANFGDAIVSNDDLTISSGTYVVKSADDGLRGKDSVTIADGTLTITAAQDAIKATNIEDQTKGNVQILGGNITINAGDDAIHAEEKLVIKAGTINIKTSNEGIEGALVTIDGGNITLYATDDGINGSASAFTTTPIVTFSGGTINVTVGAGDTDAVDSNGDLTISGGTITVTAPTSSFDYDGTATMTGGQIIINGAAPVTSIPEPAMMGGGGMRR